MLTRAILTQRRDELIAQRDQLITEIMQAQHHVSALNGAIEEVARLLTQLEEQHGEAIQGAVMRVAVAVAEEGAAHGAGIS